MNILKKVLAFVVLTSVCVVFIFQIANFENVTVQNKAKIQKIEESSDTNYMILMNDFSFDYVSYTVKKRKKFTIKHGAKAACLKQMCMFAIQHVPHEIRNLYSDSLDQKNGISYLVFDDVDTKTIFSNQKHLALVRYEISDF